MSNNKRFLALLARVDEIDAHATDEYENQSCACKAYLIPEDVYPALRALKIAISLHEPELVHRDSEEFMTGVYETRCKSCRTLFPCIAFRDIEAVVEK